MKTRILLVCMGNICRSPIAEGVLRAGLAKAGLAGEIEVDSAGTLGYHAGEAPDQRAQKAAARRGYDISGLRARRVREADFLRYDMILAMDRDNLAALEQFCPSAQRHRLGLFLGYARNVADEEVPDPYYGGPEAFEYVLDLAENAAAGLVETLRQRK
jgi:protein-tyrosine phosphatase